MCHVCVCMCCVCSAPHTRDGSLRYGESDLPLRARVLPPFVAASDGCGCRWLAASHATIALYLYIESNTRLSLSRYARRYMKWLLNASAAATCIASVCSDCRAMARWRCGESISILFNATDTANDIYAKRIVMNFDRTHAARESI